MSTEEIRRLKIQAALTVLNGLMVSNGKRIINMDMMDENIDDELKKLVSISTTVGDFFVEQIEFEDER